MATDDDQPVKRFDLNVAAAHLLMIVAIVLTAIGATVIETSVGVGRGLVVGGLGCGAYGYLLGME